MSIPLELQFFGAYLMLVVVPGWLLVRVALGRAGEAGRLERGLLALGAGYVLAMLLGLAVHLLARPAAGWQFGAGAAALSVALLGLVRAGPRVERGERREERRETR